MRHDRILRGLGAQVGEISLDAVRPNYRVPVTKAHVEVLTSYNLRPKHRREIVVPGLPAVWLPEKASRQVRRDKGIYLSDPVRHVFPRSPLEPLFRALRVMQPALKLNGIDLVTDRRNLRLLLDFIGGRNKPFRIGVHVVKNTLLMSCWQKRPSVFIDGDQAYGYEFEKAFTRIPRAIRDSITHHRVISYNLGDVKTIVRYEVDGCTPSSADRPWKMQARDCGKTPTGFRVTNWGKLVNPARILEIKTGPRKRSLNVPRNIEQLWFGDTRILCSGRYDATGSFEDISKADVLASGRLREWEEHYQPRLQMLAALLRHIVETARSALWTECAIVSWEGRLQVFKVVKRKEIPVPRDLTSMWE